MRKHKYMRMLNRRRPSTITRLFPSLRLGSEEILYIVMAECHSIIHVKQLTITIASLNWCVVVSQKYIYMYMHDCVCMCHTSRWKCLFCLTTTGIIHRSSGHICNHHICLSDHSSNSSKACPNSPSLGCHTAGYPGIHSLCYGDSLETKTNYTRQNQQ